MKKLLVLMIICGLASSASATISMLIEVNGTPASDITDVTAAGGDTIKVIFNDTSPGDGSATGPADFTYNVSGDAAYDTGSFDYSDIGPYSPTFSPWELPAVGVYTAGTGEFDLKVAGYYSSMAGPPTAGDLWWFTFTYNDGTVVVDPDYGSVNNLGLAVTGDTDIYGMATITPEPMTIVLLGIGGLFLRRRK